MQTPAILNGTKSASNSKIDCAKECPCGVAAIPVPDQWLEVMVIGGFKVWHIIFIIVALIVTLVVVYCCFHRCRIPRTKQEIEADLMRSNLTNKFRDYLQELPNEPTTFLEALRKVQDIEKKLEKDGVLLAQDATARKRLGWLKLKGKGGGQEKETTDQTTNEKETAPVESQPSEVQLSGVVTTNGILPETTPVEPNQVSNIVSDFKQSVDKPTNPVTVGIENTVDARALKQLRRRKQKPNLSRTKRTRDRSEHLDQQDPPVESDRLQVECQAESSTQQLSPSPPVPNDQLGSDAIALEKKLRPKQHKHKSSRRKEVSPDETGLDGNDHAELEPTPDSKVRSVETRKHTSRPLKLR